MIHNGLIWALVSVLNALESHQVTPHHIHQHDIPYTISAPGTYILDSNISSSWGDAITINADVLEDKLVRLDLNGFSIAGMGGINGVVVTSTVDTHSLAGIEIENGTIIGMIDHGILVGASLHSLILNSVKLLRCGTENSGATDTGGIAITGSIINTVISQCFAIGSLGFGFYLNTDHISLNECMARSNQMAGFSCESSYVVFRSCLASTNSKGFVIDGDHCSLYRCGALNNSATGITLNGQINHIVNCECMNNQGNGILNVGAGSIIVESLISGNVLCGISSSTPAIIKRNVITNSGAQGIALNAGGHCVHDNDISNNIGGGLVIALLAHGNQQIIGNRFTGNMVVGMCDKTIADNCIYSNFANGNQVNYNYVSYINSPKEWDSISYTANINQ